MGRLSTTECTYLPTCLLSISCTLALNTADCWRSKNFHPLKQFKSWCLAVQVGILGCPQRFLWLYTLSTS